VSWESLIRGLAVVAVIGLIAFLGFSVYKVYYEIPGSFNEAETEKPITLDTNSSLRAALDTLETVWEQRQDFRFSLGQDPLFLGRVIKDFTYDLAATGETQEDREIRLAATVIDDNPKAIIKYLGKSYVVQTGDYVGNVYKVIKIEKMQVVLDNNGKRLILTGKPVTDFKESRLDSEFSINTDGRQYNY
jgi:hypothetical protein